MVGGMVGMMPLPTLGVVQITDFGMSRRVNAKDMANTTKSNVGPIRHMV